MIGSAQFGIFCCQLIVRFRHALQLCTKPKPSRFLEESTWIYLEILCSSSLVLFFSSFQWKRNLSEKTLWIWKEQISSQVAKACHLLDPWKVRLLLQTALKMMATAADPSWKLKRRIKTTKRSCRLEINQRAKVRRNPKAYSEIVLIVTSGSQAFMQSKRISEYV